MAMAAIESRMLAPIEAIVFHIEFPLGSRPVIGLESTNS